MLREYTLPSIFSSEIGVSLNQDLITFNKSEDTKIFTDVFESLSHLNEVIPHSSLLNRLGQGAEELTSNVFEREVSHETFARLTLDNLEQIMNLQEITFAKLKEEEKEKFLYRRSREEYEKLLSDKDSFIVGYFKKGHLAGQLVVKKLESADEEVGKDYHISLAKKTLLEINGGIPRFSIGGMIVHPECRGNGLAQRLIYEAEKTLIEAQYPRRVCACAISSTENPGSYLSFMSCGYSMISKFLSKEDGDMDYLLYKPLSLEHVVDVNERESELPSSKSIQDLDTLDERHCVFRDKSKLFHVRNISSISMGSRGSGLLVDTQ